MAAPSKAFSSLRLIVFLTVLVVLGNAESLIETSSNTTVDWQSVDEQRTSSVKKELGQQDHNDNLWVGSGLTEEEEPEPIRGIYMEEASKELASFLRRVSNEELGVTALQSIYDSLTFGVVERDDVSRVRELSERVQGKLNHYKSLVNQSRSTVEELFWTHLHRPLSAPVGCCELPENMLRYNKNFGTGITEDLACDVSVPDQPSPFTPGHNLTDIFATNLKMAPSVKWQYFLGVDGGLSEYPAHRFDSKNGQICTQPLSPASDRRRDLFLSSVYPQPKSVVMVIDHGSALSPNQLNIAKAIGKYIVSTLSANDRIGVIALADDIHFADDCLNQATLTKATQETKMNLNRFIDGLTKAKAPADHILGFKQALEVARRSMLQVSGVPTEADDCANKTCPHWPPSVGDCPMETKEQILLVYISRGTLPSIAVPRQVLELIALGQMCLQGRLVINTYALIDEGKPIMYEKTFLQDVAYQNYTRYNFSFVALDKLSITRGQALAINSSRWLSSTVGNYLAALNAPSSTEPAFSPPWWDPIGKGLVVSLTQPCYHLDHLIGAVGMDIHLADLAEDVTYFNLPGGRSYAFIIDTSGLTLMHPALIRPNMFQDEPIATDIGLLESRPDFDSVRRRMLIMPRGSSKLVNPERNSSVLITWERVGLFPYVIGMVTQEKSSDIRTLKRVPLPSTPDLVYHRLDIVSSPAKVELCRFFRQHSTLDAGSLYLSPAAYLSSFKYETWAELQSASTIQSFMAFLNDKTKLIANPGLRSSVRSDVSALTQLVAYWKSQFGHSSLSQFIVRRYVATPSGVLNEFPAAVRHSAFDPIRRPWFQKAIEFPGRVVVTGPTLDSAGSGYVVSVSHTVYEGKAAALHGPTDDVVAVLGADFTLAYFHRLLWETLPFCPDRTTEVMASSGNIRCFLMDERGYLLAHPNLLEPEMGAGSGVEQQHLTHHEPLVASDLLNHDSFVVKKACLSYSDRTVQRFYQLNLTLTAGLGDRNSADSATSGRPLPILTNLVHGEHCIRYQIVAIPGTNLFVGIVNQTCETATAFCPCSTVDRLCLNCHRMEQSECECPCECPLELPEACDVPAAGSSGSHTESLPTCPAQAETSIPAPSSRLNPPPRTRDLDSVPLCLPLDCEERLTERECFGVVGCEWCLRDTKSHNPLQVPFCTQQNKCYGGILRGPSPYTDDSGVSAPAGSDSSGFKGLPVGPVAGGVLTFFFLVAVSVYCYRQHTRRHSGGIYVGSLAGQDRNGLRMSQLDNDMEDPDMEHDADETTAVVSHEFSLANGNGLDNVAIVSPYRVNTGYRRPAGGDSDHGYSTMTPHEDSEHTASYIEPLLIGRDRYRPAAVGRSASGGSFSSRASSPLGPVYSVSRAVNRMVDSPGTLHESADELNDSIQHRRLDVSDVNTPERTRFDSANISSTPVPGTTVLPSDIRNQMIVPVTVHMVDTT